MRVAMLVVVVLVGCGGAKEYRQVAAPMPAPAVRAPSTPTVGGYAPVGMGLPGERMPDGSERPSLPRSPNKSVKPIERGDVIHAADSSGTRKGYYPYEVSEPYTQFRGDLKDLPKRCAAIMTEAVRKAVPGLDKRDVDPIDGLCLDAMLFAMCTTKETKGRRDEVAIEAREKADTNMLEKCSSRRNDTAFIRRLAEATRKAYAP